MPEGLSKEQIGGVAEGVARMEQADQYLKILDHNPHSLRQFCNQANIDAIGGFKIDDLLE